MLYAYTSCLCNTHWRQPNFQFYISLAAPRKRKQAFSSLGLHKLSIFNFQFPALLLSLLLLALPAQATTKDGQRPKVGLVLGGGGAKGAAEVGVLKVLEEADIPIDYIAGTSIGSIIGALYSAGYRAEFLDSMFRSQQWLTLLTDREEDMKNKPVKVKDGTTYIFGFPLPKSKKDLEEGSGYNFGAVQGDSIVQLFRQLLTQKNIPATDGNDNILFDSLPIPFRCVATDIRSRREITLWHGSLPLAMRASMAIPGFFKPVSIGQLTLLDGGMLNNLPVDVVKEMGADIVIAIDLTSNKHDDSDDDSDDSWTQGGGLFGGKGIWSLIDWVVERPDLKKYKQNSQAADLYINPDLDDYSATSFNPQSISDMIAIGQETAKKQWDDIQQFKQKLQNNHP